MNLILFTLDSLRGDTAVVVDDARARHLLQVLKVSPGQEVRVGVIDGPLGIARVVAVDGAAVTLQCRFEPTAPPRPSVDLLLALPRPKVMRRLWAQLAAMGVGRILITNASRVERNYFDTHLLSVEGYRPLLVEGLQQARDTHLPVVTVHRQLKVLVEDDLDALCPAGTRLVAHPYADPITAAGRITALERVLLAVGPEGGWDDYELGLLERHRFTPFNIGPRTLRSDTACIALLAVVHAALDTKDRRV